MCEPLTIWALQFSTKFKKKSFTLFYLLQRVLKDNGRSFIVVNTHICYLLVTIYNYLKTIGFKIHCFKTVIYCLKTIDSFSVVPCLLSELLFLEQSVFKDQFYAWILQAWHEASLMSPKGECSECAGWRSPGRTFHKVQAIHVHSRCLEICLKLSVFFLLYHPIPIYTCLL